MSFGRDGKGKSRFGASFIHPILPNPTAMVPAAKLNPDAQPEDSHGELQIQLQLSPGKNH